jgi:hypothetical protein
LATLPLIFGGLLFSTFWSWACAACGASTSALPSTVAPTARLTANTILFSMMSLAILSENGPLKQKRRDYGHPGDPNLEATD